MLDTLTCTVTAICNNSEAVGKPHILCDFCRCFKDVSYDGAVFCIYFRCGSDMLLGDYEDMNGSLRINVTKSKHLVILVNLL